MTSKNSGSEQNHKRIQVMVVDDTPQVRQELRQLLELTGLFEIMAEAGDGLEAVQKANALSPNAVILDLDLPLLDGFEATRQIKARNPSTRVIILSAYTAPEEIEKARVAGADGFVMKGERYEVLVEAILGKNLPKNI